MKQNRKVLVTGAAGAQGGAMLRAVVGRGFDTYALARDLAEVAVVEAMGATGRLGNLDDRRSLEAALEGIDVLALVLPLEYDPVRAVDQGRHIVEAARESGVSRIVLNTSTRYPGSSTGVPAFEVKREVVELVAGSGLSHTIVRPTFYRENLLGPWTLPGLLNDGVFAYPIPAEVRANWVGHDDVGRVVAALVDRTDLGGRTLDVASLESTTGPELADRIARALARPITYVPIGASAFEAALGPAMGASAAAGIASLYRWLEQNPDTELFGVDAEALAHLDVAPTSFADWAARQTWGT